MSGVRNRLWAPANFSASVDEDSPVIIDRIANPWWKPDSKYSCWEIKAGAQVAEDYKKIGPKIDQELERWCRESSGKVFIWPYMLGKSISKARPVIVIASEDKASREQAETVIKRSRILKHYPHFTLWLLRYLPTGPINPVAMGESAPQQLLPSGTSFEVYFDPTKDILPIGMPIFIKHNDTSVRRATANAMYNGIYYGYMTAAHAFVEMFVEDNPPRDSEESFGFPFDSDSEIEHSGNVEMEALAHYSETPPEAPGSDRSSSTSSQYSGFCSPEPRVDYTTQPDMSERPICPNQSSNHFANPDVRSNESVIVEELELIGTVLVTSTTHDCVVISITNATVISFLESIRDAEWNENNAVVVSKAKHSEVIAWTSRGRINGTLFELPLYMRLPRGGQYELVYKFKYDEIGDIQMGDCGTLITDANSNELYGHVIADSQHGHVAFLMAAEPVMSDMKENGNWELLIAPSDQRPIADLGGHAHRGITTASVSDQAKSEEAVGQSSLSLEPGMASSSTSQDPYLHTMSTLHLGDRNYVSIPESSGNVPSTSLPLTYSYAGTETAKVDAQMIVVMGETGAGKSHFINQLGGAINVSDSYHLEYRLQGCQLIPVSIGSSKVLLIDTPSFDEAYRTDSELMIEIAKILCAQYSLGIQLKGVIYIHRITDIRYSRTATKTLDILNRICGQEALKNVFLVTSQWDRVDPAIGVAREQELRHLWTHVIGHGSDIGRFDGDRFSATALVSHLLAKDDVVLQLQKELLDEGKPLDKTVAGIYVSDYLEKKKQRYEEELASLERLKQDLATNDRAMTRQVQVEREHVSATLRTIQNEQLGLQHPIGIEIRQEIAQKRGGLPEDAPYALIATNILTAFATVPPGLSKILTEWFDDRTSGDIPSR